VSTRLYQGFGSKQAFGQFCCPDKDYRRPKVRRPGGQPGLPTAPRIIGAMPGRFDSFAYTMYRISKERG
jgi:hypothetical protein